MAFYKMGKTLLKFSVAMIVLALLAIFIKNRLVGG